MLDDLMPAPVVYFGDSVEKAIATVEQKLKMENAIV